MTEHLQEAMLEQMVALCTIIAALNESADELVKSANLAAGQPLSGAMRNVAQQQRVKVLEMHGQLAALHVAFTRQFGPEV